MPTTRSLTARQLYGRQGGFVARSRHEPGGPLGYTAKARGVFVESFERKVDPDGLLPREERQARAEAARRAHMAQLAARSASARAAKARQRKSTAGQAPDSARGRSDAAE